MVLHARMRKNLEGLEVDGDAGKDDEQELSAAPQSAQSDRSSNCGQRQAGQSAAEKECDWQCVDILVKWATCAETRNKDEAVLRNSNTTEQSAVQCSSDVLKWSRNMGGSSTPPQLGGKPPHSRPRP